jgi:hypothetical protein
VPIEAKRTVSLGAMGRGEAQTFFGCSNVNFAAAAPVAADAVPTRMKSRRVQFLFIEGKPPAAVMNFSVEKR